jgi:rare lipoprotein A
MKRVMLALLGLLLAVSLTAQTRTFRIERGTATQEMQAGGLSAAHSSYPVGSKVRVTNPANGLDIEVTITEKIPESTRRIIDLSPGAALALDLGTGGPVLITPTNIAQAVAPPPAEVKADPVPETATATASASEPEKPSLPYNITINNYLTGQDKPAQTASTPQEAPVPQEDKKERPTRRNRSPQARYEPDYSYYDEEPYEYPYMAAEQPVWYHVQPEQPPAWQQQAQPPSWQTAQPPAWQLAQPPEPPPLYTAPPVINIRIIPGLPDPHSDKLYRLFVGTYQGVDNAFRVYQQLQAAGFEVAQEQAGDMCRLYAAGIPASRVYFAAQRLGAIGFEQVWIHE